MAPKNEPYIVRYKREFVITLNVITEFDCIDSESEKLQNVRKKKRLRRLKLHLNDKGIVNKGVKDGLDKRRNLGSVKNVLKFKIY